MRNYIIVLYILSFFAANSLAAHKTAQAEVKPIRIEVVYGEKTTWFTVTASPTKGHVELFNNSGRKDSREISLKDYNFLKNKIVKISGSSNEKRFCNRNYILIQRKNKNLLGCLGASNAFARQIQQTTNLISLLF